MRPVHTLACAADDARLRATAARWPSVDTVVLIRWSGFDLRNGTLAGKPAGVQRSAVVPTDTERAAEFAARLGDDQARGLRERVAFEVPQCLAENGLRLANHHWLSGDVAGRGFATATEMAAELGAGAARLFVAELSYAGAALVRQLLECTYLLTLMAEDRREAETWMTSSHAESVARFMPGQMRKRSVRNFRQSEYERHCDQGGHPNPAGRHFLRSHLTPEVSRLGQWVDLAQHLADTWDSFVAGLSLYDPRRDAAHHLYSPQRSPDGGEAISDLLAEWRRVDPLARHPPTGGLPSARS